MINTTDELLLRIETDAVHPLFGNELAIGLRIEYQNFLFGGGFLSQKNIARGNVKFYKWVWNHKPHVCEESGQSLDVYHSSLVSHILSRGSHPEMRWDPRNVNILHPIFHRQWETGNRVAMKIYPKNQPVIDILKWEYSQR